MANISITEDGEFYIEAQTQSEKEMLTKFRPNMNQQVRVCSLSESTISSVYASKTEVERIGFSHK